MKNHYLLNSSPPALPFLFLLPSLCSTFGCLLQELLLLPKASCTTPCLLPSLTFLSFPTLSLLFLFCFPMSHPIFQSLFLSYFLHFDFLVPSFEPLQLSLVASFCPSATSPYELLSLPWPRACVPCVVLLTHCWSFLDDPINWCNAHMALRRYQNRCHRCTWTILSHLALTQSQQHSPSRTTASGTCCWWQPGLPRMEALLSAALQPPNYVVPMKIKRSQWFRVQCSGFGMSRLSLQSVS